MSADALDEEPPILILCTAPSAGGHAERLARGLVEKRLVACVNLIEGVRSTYRWDNAVQTDTEHQLILKTRKDRLEEVVAWLVAHHPYDEPEVIAVPIIGGSTSYLAWVNAESARVDLG